MDNEKEIKEIALAVNVVQENGDEIAKNDMYDMLELREKFLEEVRSRHCLLYTSPSPRDS